MFELYYNPNGVEQRRWENTAIHLHVVGDAESLPWPTPTTAAGMVAGNCITTPTGLHNNSHRWQPMVGCSNCITTLMGLNKGAGKTGLFISMLLVTLNLYLGQHRTTAAGMVAGNYITTPTGLHNGDGKLQGWWFLLAYAKLEILPSLGWQYNGAIED